jgi:hypothetical protein
MPPRSGPARLLGAAALLGAAGCAETAAPLPAPEEVVLVAGSGDATLTIVPVAAPAQATTVRLARAGALPTDVAARGATAAVPLRGLDAVAVVDLRERRLAGRVPLEEDAGLAGVALVSDSVAYVANAARNTVTRVSLPTGDTASVAVGRTPRGIVFTRGRVLVVNANLDSTGAPAGESWITVVDPTANARAGGTDSIPLAGPGNAGAATVGSDGLVYVLQAGGPGEGPARLSLVDPVALREVAAFAGFGVAPGDLAAGGGDRLLVSSPSEGVMEFDVAARRVVRGEGNGVRVPENSGVAVDGEGRIYALEAGCGARGVIHVLRPDFSESRTVPAGRCAFAARVARVPPSGVPAAEDTAQ